MLVDAKGQDVTLILDGADITCSWGSPIYIYKAENAVIELSAGSENRLADGTAYSFADSYSSAEDEEPNACLYSKADLTIQGSGSLTVEGNYNNGVTSKDTLTIVDATLDVTAVNHGVNGKDSNDIRNAAVTVKSGGDAVRSSNDTDSSLGWVRVTDSTLELVSGEDGIQAETVLELNGGNYTVTSGGGSGSRLASDDSAKGLKAGTSLVITDGSFALDCSDDAVHSNGDLSVSGGSFTVATGDDAFHADAALTVSGGSIAVTKCYEGLEGVDILISGGEARIVSSDDGINAGGGADGSGFSSGWGFGDRFGGGSAGNYSLTMTGGYVVVAAGGDGFDSNGTATLSGGTLIVSSSGNADGALDSERGVSVTGGTLLAAGGGMPESPEASGQNALAISFGTTLPAGTLVCVENGGRQFVLQLPVSSSTLMFSAPELTDGAATVSYGGSYSGNFTDGIGDGGTYTGGTELAQLTLSGGTASYGTMGGMGNFGGRGGMGSMGGFGGQRGQSGDGQTQQTPGDGQMPSDGQMPQMPADGQAPQMPSDGQTPQFPGGQTGDGSGGRQMPGNGGFPGGRR